MESGDGKLVCPGIDLDLRHDLLHVGQQVVAFGAGRGIILGFGHGLFGGITVFTRLESGQGNRGTFHTCGDLWVVPSLR